MPTSVPNQAATIAPKPRTSLNKRVAFPMQSSAASQSTVETTAEGLPLPFSTAKYQPSAESSAPPPQVSSSPPPLLPPPKSASPATVLCNPEISTAQSTLDNFDAATARDECVAIFGRFADKMATTNTEPSKLNEIRKRLELLHHMWQENKLDDSIQRNLHAMAKGLFFFYNIEF